MLKTSMQRYSCCLPYTMACGQSTPVSRQSPCFNSKALEGFSVSSGIQSSVHTWCSWLLLAGTLPGLGDMAGRGDRETHQNRAWLQTGKLLTHTHRPHLANGAKAAFLLHKSFTSFKYCDNWSALVVTIQVQEPGLASIMNTVCLSHLLPTRLNQHPSSKNKNNLMKIGKCAPDIKLFRLGLLSLQC